MARQLSRIVLKSTLKATLQNFIDGATQPNISWDGGVDQSIGTLTTGTGADQANVLFQDTNRPLASGAHDDINLYSFAGIDMGAGAGNDATGRVMTLAEIVGILIYVQRTSAGVIAIGGQGTANAWTSWISSNAATVGPYSPGACFEFWEPVQPAFVVGAASNNLLRIAASGGAVVYDMYVIGRQP